MPGPTIPRAQRLSAALLHVLPHHLISRAIFYLPRRRSPLTPAAIRWFVRRYGVDLDEAEHADAAAYPTFNAFFTRALRPGARPLAAGDRTVLCPVDGTVSALGTIHADRIIQAKALDYSVAALLGDERLAEAFQGGRFATLYLSPRDYHRVHMPLAGTLQQMRYIPGRLFSVAPVTVDSIPGLFTRNERVVSVFRTDAGPLAIVLVGAINVAAIETVWSGLITPPRGRRVQDWHYPEGEGPDLARGAEMGRFNMGSTVVVLTGASVTWRTDLGTASPVRLGQDLGAHQSTG